MRRKIIVITLLIIVTGLAFSAGYFIINWENDSHVTVAQVLRQTLAKRQSFTPFPTSTTAQQIEIAPTPTGTINILLLGLDSRKTATSSRCDAIHMITLDTDKWTVHITSMPRGTHAIIPGVTTTSEAYISNACGMMGVKYGISQIEQMLHKKADYVIKVGFSQTFGIFRLLQIPTNESLQWLRDRKSFAIGDPQRSHNQAVFMKDVALRKINLFAEPAMYPVAKVAYSFVDTDLDFPSFYALVRGYADAKINEHPEKIELSMWPIFYTKDYHFDFNNPNAFVTGMKASIPTSSLSDKSFDIIQTDLIKYIKNRLASKASIKDVVTKQLWLQVDDETTRETLEFEALKRQIKETSQVAAKQDLVNDYIFEKQTFGQDAWAQKGQDLLVSLTTSTP